MNNPFIFSDSNKRYQTFDYYLKSKYGQKVFKVSLNAHFSCPNRDGTISKGGCIFCSESGSGEYAGNITHSLKEQYYEGLQKMRKKWPMGLGIAYFQSFTNTYGSLDYLHSCYDQFIDMTDCVGISIATRPDCLNDQIISYLAEINTKTDLYIELGLQTSNDKTAELINRGCKFETFKNAVRKLAQNNIKVVVHIINGLPNETEKDMINTIKDIANLPIFGIKFHCLNILKNTMLSIVYKELNLHILDKEEYLKIVSKQLSYLPSNIVVERINTDAVRKDLIAPLWNDKKVSVSNDLDKIMSNNSEFQGKNHENLTVFDDFIYKFSRFNTSYNNLILIGDFDMNLIISLNNYYYNVKHIMHNKNDESQNNILVENNNLIINKNYYALHSIDMIIINNMDNIIINDYLPYLSNNGRIILISNKDITYTMQDIVYTINKYIFEEKYIFEIKKSD